jgi:hypothetical protein
MRTKRKTIHPLPPKPSDALMFAMRYLAHSAPTATGTTVIFPDGASRYISRAEAEEFVFGPHTSEAPN